MKKYWVCIIEVDEEKLPDGFDFVPRRGAIDAIEDKGIEVKECWSGWGFLKERIQEIQNIMIK